MKYLKMLGLAGIAAIGLIAIAEAGSASATVLCETNVTSGCGNSWDVGQGTDIDFSLEPNSSALLKETPFPGGFGLTIATCTESTAKGPTTNTSGTAVTGQLDETLNAQGDPRGLTFGNCTNTVTVRKAGSFTIKNGPGTKNGEVQSTNATLTIVAFGLNCLYETATDQIGTITGNVNSAPTLDISARITSTNGCPEAVWTASYGYTGTTNFAVAAN